MRWVDRIAESFGGVWFLLGFNIFTGGWMLLGNIIPHFFDPFPFIFYTLVVSWLAINMSALILWSDRRKAVKAQSDDAHKLQTLETLLTLAQSEEDHAPLIRQIAENQVAILEHLTNISGDHRDMKRQHTALIATLQRFVKGDDHTG